MASAAEAPGVEATAAAATANSNSSMDPKPSNNNNNNKPASKMRKRAAKACLSCRARKVRCDVSQRGSPCMNCYLDGETCVVTGRASRLRRSQRDQNEENEDVVRSRLNGDPASPSAESIDAMPNECQPGHQHNSYDDVVQVDGQDNTGPPPIQQPMPLNDNSTYGFNDSNRNAIPFPNVRNPNPIATSYFEPSLPGADSSLWFGDRRVTANGDITYSYYPFLAVNNLHNILPQDVNYLEQQGCLRVPTREIFDEFMQQYFLHVHPMMPFIDEGHFWDMYGHYGSGGSGEKMSLLVLQAMLFASCNFVSKPNIKALGFPSIRAARALLYRRAKLLYDFESECDMVHLSQAALLLSHWAPNFTNAFKKANSGWLSAAVQNAKSAEAHHYAALDAFRPVQYKKQNTLKRLWWCCVIRDRILSLGMRRSLKITPSHFDFEGNPGLGYAELAGEVNRSRVYNPGTKRRLIEIFGQIVELCAVLTDLLTMVFPLDDSPGWGKKTGAEELVRVGECKHALRLWYKTATLKFPLAGGNEFQHDSVILYTNLMYMYYHSSRVALSHHEVLQTAVAAASPNLTSNLREFSSIYENRHELQDAASGVTECLKELMQLRLARWLPISAVAATALPLVLHILDVKLSSHNKSSSSNPLKQHRLNILIQAMKSFQPQYDGVDYISETIRHIVNLTQLDTPAPLPTAKTATTTNISDWTDILASQPGCYLRLAMTMDLSLSKGRLPDESDFPDSLRGLFTTNYSSIKALLDGIPAAGKAQHTAVPAAAGTVHSISSSSSSEEDIDSPGSAAEESNNSNSNNDNTLFGADHVAMDDVFVDAAGLDLDGDIFMTVSSLSNNHHRHQRSNDNVRIGDDDIDTVVGGINDWIGSAWGNEVVVDCGVVNDAETAGVLLDVLRESEAIQGN